MDVIDTLTNIANTNLIKASNLRFCFHKNKVPYTIKGELARPNTNEDFATFEDLLECPTITEYSGVGISVNASKISTIDVDHCFETAFDINSGDDRAKDTIAMFKDKAYIEFSFSGTGLRVIFANNLIEDYSTNYYTKNEKTKIEYYQYTGGARYVTVTGRVICDNLIREDFDFKDTIIEYLNKYMSKPKRTSNRPKPVINSDDKTLEDIMKQVKIHLFRYTNFQDLWYDRLQWRLGKQYQGQGESEHDFALLQYIYYNFTQDKDLVREVFEKSEYFKTKDKKHKDKWYSQDYRYFNFMFDRLE